MLAELLGLKPGSDPVSTILDYLDRHKIVLFIDDYQEVEDQLEELVNEARDRLRVARLIVASRVRAKGKYSCFPSLGGLIDEEAKAKIRDEMKSKDVDPSKDNVRLVHERTRGHPLAIEMFVALLARRVLSPKELAKLGAIRDVRDEGEVRDFILRIVVENVDEKDLKLLEYLSVFRGGFNLNMIRTVMKGLGDDRASQGDKELESGLIKPLMRSNIIEPAKEAFPYNFMHGMVREAAYSRLEDLVKAHKFAIEVYRGLRPSAASDAEIIHHAEQLLSLEKEEEARRELIETILECSGRLSTAAYLEGLARLAVEYGFRAFTAASTLRKPVEALIAAEKALRYAADAQLARSRAEELHGALEKLYHEALKLDEDKARLGYASALWGWAIYTLNALRDMEEAEKALEEALEAVGGPENRHIKDPLKWYERYSAVLAVKADVAMLWGRYGEARKLLQEWRELFKEFKERRIAEHGEEAYFRDLAVLESQLADLALRETGVQNAMGHYTEALKASVKARQNNYAASARLNLAKVGVLLAQDVEDFAQAAEGEVMGWSLGKALEFFERSGDGDGEAKARLLMALALLVEGRDRGALEQAEKALAKVWEGVDEFVKAVEALCLVYVKLTKNLEEFRKEGALVKEVLTLTHYGVEVLEKRRSTGYYLGSWLLALEDYLLGRLTWKELLDLAMRARKGLEEAGDKGKAQVLGWA